MENNEEEHDHNNIHVVPRRVEVIYRRKTRERKIFMDELKEVRKRRDKHFMKRIIASIGPNWYYELSEPQRRNLDTLEFCIYQDVLAGRPVKTKSVIRQLGLHPRPTTDDIMHCVIAGRKDPKQMLSNLFGLMFGHTIDGKRAVYDMNGKLLLSSILYLGMPHLIKSLQIMFYNEPQEIKEIKPEPKPKPILKSPYLQEMVACQYKPPKRKPQRPPPLPHLDTLNEPFEVEPVIRKPPPLPPPPPPPKKRLPRSYCDRIAGIVSLEPRWSIDNLSMKPLARSFQRRKTSKISILEDKKKLYGISATPTKKVRRRKPVAPSTGLKNSQYLIKGVSIVHGRYFYLLGNVSILPPDGEMIHGGYAHVKGENININCGYRAHPPPPAPDPCDCLELWNNSVFEYIKNTKCHCGHYYDFGNDGAFLPDELPFFEKPTQNTPFRFNYQTIYDLDEKQLFVEKQFKKLWDTDSVLGPPGDHDKDKRDKKKLKVRRLSASTINENLKPEDYLKSALRKLRRDNIAARLPDVHLVPLLKEWMRHRIYGPYSAREKARLLSRSCNDWQKFWALSFKDYMHVFPPKDPNYAGHTNWLHKHSLNQHFRKYTRKYKIDVFKAFATFNNMLWTTMCQAQFPGKNFREIYFSYLYDKVEDLLLMHPYSVGETAERKKIMENKRYSCYQPIERDE
ncbi:uncharacterized protein LOC106719560 [Papilio machaon]|uniref:uncharacterized protein LOC106719560 n=1 Tax=Papilio machaon TaxID=76193 RepID=UPI001E662E64|nr:uncharacterized protein LOC106719560 [Papilio machaon]